MSANFIMPAYKIPLIFTRRGDRGGAHSLIRIDKKPIAIAIGFFGAAYEARTRYLHLGKVALYQMS
jgi:hypothetical protein